MKFLEQAGEELSAPVNKHWREVAEYERYVMPLIVRLQSVDWPAVLALQSARWHREAIDEIWARKQRYGCYCWIGNYYNPSTKAGRQIQRYPLKYGLYPIRFCPPAGPPVSWGFWFHTSDFKRPGWTPEAYAWRSYKARRELVEQWLVNRETVQRNGPNRRQYLADRLGSISHQLGRYVRKDYWNANGMFYEESYTLDFDLSKALAINDKNGSYHSLDPSALGEVEARLDHFWRCLKEFHEAETPAPVAIAETPVPTIPLAKAAPDAEVLRSLLADVHQHFPGILTRLFMPYPPELILPDLACYVGRVWASPRQHSAPQDFDRAYYNQSPAGRRDFLAALRRVYDALTKELSSDPFGSQLFATMSWKETNEAPAQSKEIMHALAQRGAAWLGGWLNWRELSSADQLLAALETVGIANHSLRLTAAEPERPPCLYVPDCAPEDDGPRFAALLREFERALPGKNSKRRDLLRRLERLRTLPLALLRDGPPHTLPARFSALHWPDLLQWPAGSEVLETFWPDLEQALKTRIEWAGRAYSIVAGMLPAPAPQPFDTPAPNSPRASPATTDAASLFSPTDRILGLGFTLDEADRLAHAVGLTDETGRYCLGPRRLGAVVGFALALQQSGKLIGAIPALTAVLAPRWGVQVATRKTSTGVADKYFRLTTKALARP